VDYFLTVPPQSSAKKRATQHALINLTNVALFIFAVYYRQTSGADTTIVLAIEIAGVLLLSVAGWMGGTLVHRNQIGIDHRYANAGKWNEEYIDGTNGKIEVASTDELKLNAMKLVHINKQRIVIGRTDKGYVAFSDHCTHRGGSLADGTLICQTVQCPWHGSQFDVENGIVTAGPAKEKITIYKIEEKDGKIFLLL
ncbi:MAG TPA: Rieske 2Fe-2S domain-containing protein, partial [Flavisolibacter sp.]|nr:Rieske 2Fe-2S domain-containing protein [Flavisolibacter sp.]